MECEWKSFSLKKLFSTQESKNVIKERGRPPENMEEKRQMFV